MANLQNVLIGRKGGGEDDKEEKKESSLENDGSKPKKPVVLLTNSDGIGSPGLEFLVEALVRDGRCDVHVCAPDSEKPTSAHSVTLRDTVAVNSTEMHGATAFEVYGTPVDCVSLALSGALFSWSRPVLVVSGINKGSSCGHNVLYSGAIAGAREALMRGIPSLSISLNWRKDESKENDFKDAVDICLPLIHAAIRDSEKGIFPSSCLLNIEVPSSPTANKGFKVTKQSVWRPTLNWQAVSANRNPVGQYMSMQQSLGVQLAQLGRDASAAAAARRVTTQKKHVEIESVASEGKPESRAGVKKYFRLEEFGAKEDEDTNADLDFRAVEQGFVAVTPLHFHVNAESDIQASASSWLASALTGQEDT